MFDMNDAEPQKTGELIPDGTFAKVTMLIRPGGSTARARSIMPSSRHQRIPRAMCGCWIASSQ
jgi:hypothetical protein